VVGGVDAEVAEALRGEGVDGVGAAILHTEDVKESKGVEDTVIGFSREDASELEHSIVVDAVVDRILKIGKIIQDGAARGAAGDRAVEKKDKGVLVHLARFDGLAKCVNGVDNRGLVGGRGPGRGFPTGEVEEELGQQIGKRCRDGDHIGVVIDQEFERNSGASAEGAKGRSGSHCKLKQEKRRKEIY
jgi:hypothetical protein